MPFRTTRMVEFSDTDMAGIVHFASFFRFMESAEHAYLRACGLSVYTTWEGRKVTFPRVNASCDFLKPIRFEEVVEIEVSVERIGRTSVQYSFVFRKDAEVIARGRITTVLCVVRDDHSLEPLEVPASLRERLLAGNSE